MYDPRLLDPRLFDPRLFDPRLFDPKRRGAFHELKQVERALSRHRLSAEQRRRLRPVLARLAVRVARSASLSVAVRS